jgi:cellulose synthase/poly-beta-1,6-N-acetylglucosamine synthase-like glycosyltransferase
MKALYAFNAFALVYFLVLNTTYLILIAIAAWDVVRMARRARFQSYDDIFANPLTPPVSVIIPAHNEATVIVESVRAMLALRFSEFEVIVVDDGSTDDTFAVLQSAFALGRIDKVVPGQIATVGAITDVYASASEPLTVVRKVGAGRRSDAVNAGVDIARYPLVCMVDADSILEERALLSVVKPFVDDPERVVATGGLVRVANGASIYRGRVEDARHSHRWLARIQHVEYIRSFLLGRMGWSHLDSLLIISGAFGVFRRDVVLEVGGLDPDSLGEDAELVATIHEYMRDNERDYRIVFVPEPVCWTEVPESLSQLAKQRERWSRGLLQLLRKHRRMIGNPRYGRLGTLSLPYHLAFEVLGPVVEVLCIFTMIAGLLTGAVTLSFAALFAFVAVGYGLFVSACALTIEELAFRRYRRWTDLQRSIAAACAENLGYRQLHSWWRLRGLVAELRKTEGEWGRMERKGFGTAPSGLEPKGVVANSTPENQSENDVTSQAKVRSA